MCLYFPIIIVIVEKLSFLLQFHRKFDIFNQFMKKMLIFIRKSLFLSGNSKMFNFL